MTIIKIFLVLVFLVFWTVLARLFGPFIRAYLAGCPVSFRDIIHIRLSRLDLNHVIDAFIVARKAEADATIDQMIQHCVAGGNLVKVAKMLVKTKARGLEVPFEFVARTDLAGHDLDEMDPDIFKKAIVEEG